MDSSRHNGPLAGEGATEVRRGGAPLRSLLRARAPELLAVGAVAVVLAAQLSFTKYNDVVPHSSFGFIIAVAMLGAAALLQSRRDRRAATPAPAYELPPRTEIMLVAAVFVLAIFFRFWHLLSFPPGLWSDEGVNANDALSLIDGDHTRIWFDTVFGRSTLYLYLLAGSFKVFGFTIFAIRVVPALAGLAAVVAFYPLARHLVGAVPALVATALLAASRWAVTFSRISWEASVQPVIEILAIYFLMRGIEKKSRASFALAGAALAAGLYTYIAFRMVPIVAALLLVYVAATQWRLIRANIAGIALCMLAFAAVVAPLANFALHNQDRFLQRTREVNVFKEIDREASYDPLRHNIRASVKMMNVAGDVNGRHNLPGAPMLDDVTAALFVLGLAVSVWSLRNWRRGSIAPWFALSLVPGALTLRIENPSGIRDIGAIPPLFLLVGLAVASVYRPFSSTRNGLVAFCALALALVAGSTALNYDELFRQQAHNKDVYDGFTPVYARVGEIVASEAGSRHVYVSQPFYSANAVRILGHGKQYAPYTPAYDIVFARRDKDALIILEENQSAIIDTLRRLYPNLRRAGEVDPFGRARFIRVTIPASDVMAAHDLTLTHASANEAPAPSARAPLDREWTAGDLARGPIDATWDGYLWVSTSPGDTTATLTVPGTSASIEVDGKPVPLLASGGDVILGPLSIGEHRIRIGARITTPGRVKMQLAIGAESLLNAPDAADVLYGTSTGSGGFQVAYRAARDFSGDPVAVARFPFAVPAPAINTGAAIEYRGIFDAPSGGSYGLALDGSASSQLFVDDELVIDNGGGHPRRRVEATLEVAPGPHTVAIQYLAVGPPDWSLLLRRPGEDWTRADGSEFRVPEGAVRATASVTITPDAGPWGATARKFDGLSEPVGVAVMPDGAVVAGGGNRIVLIGPDGAALRSFTLDVKQITDVDVTASGEIVVVDGASRSLLLVTTVGEVVRRFDAAFASAFGVGVDAQHNMAYVASPAGGIVYRVPLAGGPVDALPISAPEAPVRATQPSDVVVSDSGVFYIIDFEKQKIVRSPDGAAGRAFRGVGGSGGQLPRLALFGRLVLVTDPLNERIVAYDTAGKQRGVYVFPPTLKGTRPIGIAVAPGANVLYVADASGFVQRLKIDVPPATAADLSALP